MREGMKYYKFKYPERKQGAEITVQKKGEQATGTRWKDTPWEKPSGIKGELIAVKKDSLLLHEIHIQALMLQLISVKSKLSK